MRASPGLKFHDLTPFPRQSDKSLEDRLFSLIKFALHFGAYPMSSLDPMLIELIREERRQQAAEAMADEMTACTEDHEEVEERRKAA